MPTSGPERQSVRQAAVFNAKLVVECATLGSEPAAILALAEPAALPAGVVSVTTIRIADGANASQRTCQKERQSMLVTRARVRA
jgi:hypothetical protein